MASRFIDQPTAGFAPRLTQNSAGPITSAGSGSNQMGSPTFSAASTNSPFSTAGPLLGGLMGAILANRDAVKALEEDRAKKAAAIKSGSSSGATAAVAKAASNAAKDLIVNQPRTIAEKMIKNVLPDYQGDTYQDNLGNRFLNSSLVNGADVDIGEFFPSYDGNVDFSSLTGGGEPYFPDISFSGPDYSNLEFPSSIYDNNKYFPDISFSSPDYIDYDFSSPTYDNNQYFPDISFSMPDYSDFDFGFKNGGMVPMMKKGGLASFEGGGMVNAAPETEKSFLDSLTGSLPSWVMDYINSATNNVGGTVLGAGAGAALGQLLSGMTQNVGGVNQGVDMSKVGVIAPHTTTFGMGPTRHVGYEEYGSPSGEDVYANTNLYQNLGTPQKQPVGGLSGVQQKADGGAVHFTYGNPVDAMQIMQGSQEPQGMRNGGTPEALGHPEVNGRMDLRHGAYVRGPGDGQSDDIPAMLADGEYVFDADTVAALGNGSNEAGAEALDKMREAIRRHKRSAPINKIPPPAKSPLAYLKGSK
jgi:hypothetical protein